MLLRSAISGVDVVATGSGLREQARLSATFGEGRWRKMKRFAWVETRCGEIVRAEVHWYEAHGVGRREMKIKRHLG